MANRKEVPAGFLLRVHTVFFFCFFLEGVEWGVGGRGLQGSKNSYPNPKRPVNVLRGTDPDPYFI